MGTLWAFVMLSFLMLEFFFIYLDSPIAKVDICR